MATYFGFTNVDFTSSGADYNLFENVGVRLSLIERLGITDEELTEKIQSGGISDINYQILISGTKISINNNTYQPPFDDILVSSGDYVRSKTFSIRVQDTGISGQFRFNIL